MVDAYEHTCDGTETTMFPFSQTVVSREWFA